VKEPAKSPKDYEDDFKRKKDGAKQRRPSK